MGRKTKLEIIDETVAYYSEDVSRRAVTHHAGKTRYCYCTQDGKMCAVGRFLKNAYETEREHGGSSAGELPKSAFNNGYASHGYDFWEDLQHLHDEASFWAEDGLSEDGKCRVEMLKGIWAGK